MFDKLQFVAAVNNTTPKQSHDKLKFVGHFDEGDALALPSSPALSRLRLLDIADGHRLLFPVAP